MKSEVYKSAHLLAELRSAVDWNNTEECEICHRQNQIVCTHLTETQYSSLKAAKRTSASERARGNKLRVFECGHVFDNLYSVRRSTPGPKKKTKGLCDECWRYIASDGRRMRSGRDRNKRRPNSSHRSKIDTTRHKRLRGRFRAWRIRGPMIGKLQV